ncbi:hypothetical protein F1559_000794 [Cyanidiococcus yangmingshanensis]|uniref:DUF1365 family protein n=1 Tax=Cyanidiococcus yangmingshanensis TaxID=2690220 RepID=A0A7J7IMI3_9RHOD|nr:hypothetical protein F1559_000794 [Cyanidiococcus yangmingshanensis]
MRSALYCGSVTHSRRFPDVYQFTYTLFMAYLDLTELAMERWRFPWWPLFSARRWLPAVAWLRSKHHMREIAHAWPRKGSASQASVLADAVRRYVQRELGLASTPCGRVCVLTHLTYLGIAFNPVSFYYLFDEQDQRVKYVVAEVNNIPWFEQHAYVLCANEHTQSVVQSLSRTNSLVGTRNAPLDDEDCIRPATEHERHLGSASRNGRNAFSTAEDACWPVDESKPSATVEACGLSAPRWPWWRPSLERTGSTSSLNGSTPSSSCFVLCAAHPKAFHVSPFIGMEGY